MAEMGHVSPVLALSIYGKAMREDAAAQLRALVQGTPASALVAMAA